MSRQQFRRRGLVHYTLPNNQVITVPHNQVQPLVNAIQSMNGSSRPFMQNVPNLPLPQMSGVPQRQFGRRGRYRAFRGRFASRNGFSNNNQFNANRYSPNYQERQTDTQTMSRCEKWFDVIPGANKYEFLPGKSGIPQLDRFAGIFENYQLRYASIIYKPSAGTTVPGNVTMGIDYNPNGPDRKAEDIPLLDPNSSGSVFSEHCLTLINNRVMKGKTWLYTSVAGTDDPASRSFALYVDAQTESRPIGQIWIDYKIAFCTATSPSGISSAVPIPLAVSSTEIVDSVQICPASDTVVGSEESVPIKIDSSMDQVEVDKDNVTTFETSFEFDSDKVNKGDTFTIGSVMTTPPALSYYRSVVKKAPKITFMYADGTPVPDGSIMPLSQAPRIHTDTQNSDIFATLFSIVKPLVKPFLGVLQELVEPTSGEKAKLLYAAEGAEPITESILEMDPELKTDFAFFGDEATITVPNNDDDQLSARISTNLMVYGGRGYASPVENFVSVYDYNIWSFDSNWLYAVDKTTSGFDSKLKVCYANPDKDVNSFSVGDLVFLHFAGLPLDSGFGSSVKTSFPCKAVQADVDAIIKELEENSFLSDSPVFNQAKPVDSPVFQKLFYQNNTANDQSGANVGLSIVGRFVGTTPKAFKYLICSMFVGQLFTTVPKENTNVPKPEGNYSIAAFLCQVQFFPTESLNNQPDPTPTFYAANRVH